MTVSKGQALKCWLLLCTKQADAPQQPSACLQLLVLLLNDRQVRTLER